MPTTTYKGYEVQTTGSNTGTWGDVLNDDALDIIDSNMGGVVTLSLSASNVTLSAPQSQAAILRLTGTLLANIQITTSCQGFFFVENATTGSFAVTVYNGVGTARAVAQGLRTTCIADTTNGVRVVTGEFATGTSMSFFNSTAPTGWTKITSTDNALIRLVSGTPSSGGTNDFSTVNSSTVLTRANLPNDSIATSTDGAHTHTVSALTFAAGSSYSSGGGSFATTVIASSSNGSHNHTVALNGGVTQTALDLNIKYVDIIRATKD